MEGFRFLGVEMTDYGNVTMLDYLRLGPPISNATLLRTYPVQYFLHERTINGLVRKAASHT